MNLKEIQKRHEADQKRFDNMSWDDVEQTEWDMHEDRAWLLDRIHELAAQLAEKDKLLLAAFQDAKQLAEIDKLRLKYGEWIAYLQEALEGDE